MWEQLHDVVMCTSLCYDTWRIRHNDVQRALVAKAHEARVEVDAEVLGLFRDAMPYQALEAGGNWKHQGGGMVASWICNWGFHP